MAHLLSPPSRVEHRGNHPLFGRLTYAQGLSLLKTNGLYRLVEMPSDEDIQAAQVTYLGGHVYSISDQEVADLTAAGYGAWIYEGEGPVVSPPSGGGGTGGGITPPTHNGKFGAGQYGSGDYGGAA